MIRFAVPGDLNARTGGYGYDRRLIEASSGALTPLALPGGFPFPSAEDLAETARLLAGDGPLLIDGLAFGALPAALIEGLARPPVALCHHPLGLETGLTEGEAARLIAAERAALDRAAHIVVTSPRTAGILTRDFGQAEGRITVAPPGLDRAAPARPDPNAPPVLLTVASMTRRKGHDLLFDALARISDLDWRAIWAGPEDMDPAWTAEMTTALAEAGLTERVERLGPVDAARLEALYAAASIFVLPSRYEGYGMVYAEAMMRALPLVACQGGAAPDIVPRGAGRVVPDEDPPALAAALAELIGDRDARAKAGEAGRAHALTLPGWDGTWAQVQSAMERA